MYFILSSGGRGKYFLTLYTEWLTQQQKAQLAEPTLRVVSKYHFSLKGVRVSWRDSQTQVWEEKTRKCLEHFVVWKAGKDQTKILSKELRSQFGQVSTGKRWDNVNINQGNKDME